MFQVKDTGFKDWLVPALGVLAVTVLLLVPLPVSWATQRWPAMLYELENLGHPLIFGLLAHSSFRSLRRLKPAPGRAPYMLVLLGAALFGVATEALQRLVGRVSAWIDVANDVFGAGFVLLLHLRRERQESTAGPRSTTTIYTAGAAAVFVALLVTVPFLWTVAAYGNRSVQSPVLWRADSLLFERFTLRQARYSAGIAVLEPVPDWTAYRTLAIELRNLRSEVSPIWVRVHDLQHNQEHADRYNEAFELAPSANLTLRIPLEKIRLAPRGRTMNLATIRGVHIFQPAAKQPIRFSISEIRLER